MDGLLINKLQTFLLVRALTPQSSQAYQRFDAACRLLAQQIREAHPEIEYITVQSPYDPDGSLTYDIKTLYNISEIGYHDLVYESRLVYSPPPPNGDTIRDASTVVNDYEGD